MHRLAIPVMLAVLTVSGCNTVSGVGRDVQLVGQVLAKTANDANRTRGACTPDVSRAPPRTCPPRTTQARYVPAKPAAKPTPLKTALPAGVSRTAAAGAEGPASTNPGHDKPDRSQPGWYVWP